MTSYAIEGTGGLGAVAEIEAVSESPTDLVRVLDPDGGVVGDEPSLTDDEVVAIHRAMLRTRMTDERAGELQRERRIGFHIGSLGEEASIIGSAAGLRPSDWIFPCYREFGSALFRGLPMQRYWDHLCGNAGDLCKGRQMPDHLAWRDGRLASVSSPVGTQIIHAVGFSWAAKLRGDPLAALVFFGDGATSAADFHNGMNFAGVFKTPTVFLCRNNGWAISLPRVRQTASETLVARFLAEKGVAYGVPGVRCDGNDVLAVIQCVRQAVAAAARGEGATLIEAVTFRRAVDQRDTRALALDPIARMRRYLARRVGWDDANERALTAEIGDEVEQAATRALAAEPPPLASMFEDVFEERPLHLSEQSHALLQHKGLEHKKR